MPRPNALPPTTSHRRRQMMRDAFVLLGSTTDALAGLLRDVRAGDAAALKAVGGRAGDLERAMRAALAAEARYFDWLDRQKESPPEPRVVVRAPTPEEVRAAAPELDLDEVRRDVARRLDRLRAAGAE